MFRLFPLNIYVVFPFLCALCKIWILSYQLVMQYLYCGGTEALHIRNTDVMEVRSLVSRVTNHKHVYHQGFF